MMDHKEASELLPAYVDQELAIADAVAIEHHLNGCHECQAEYAVQSAVSARLKRDATYFKAPASLARRVQRSLPRDRSLSTGFKALDFTWLPAGGGSKAWNASWLGAGTVAASTLALVWAASLYLALPSDQARLTEELISSHVRSLQVEHLSDVASSDKHTVKPWFNGKLDFAPPVVDLASQDFPLEGGRLDYVDGRTVAVLVYRYRKHPINLYVWPTSDRDAAPQAQDRQGYHLVRWTSGGMKYWAVSDLATNELEVFAGALRSQR
jgi:anti-sigma factor RsiW